jgi:hypothetical protein
LSGGNASSAQLSKTPDIFLLQSLNNSHRRHRNSRNLVDIKVVVLVEIAKQLSCIVVLFLALLQDIRNTGNPPPRTIEFDLLFVEFAVIAVSGNVVRLRRLIQAFQGCLVGVYSAGLKLAIELGWLQLHESGTYVKFTQAGAELFAYHSLSKIGAGF